MTIESSRVKLDPEIRKEMTMPRFSDDVFDANLELAENNLDELIVRLEQEEEDEYYRSLGPRAFGPDIDEE